MSALCLCLTAPDITGALKQAERYRDCIDMVELRVDLLDPQERSGAAGIPSRIGLPSILTVRLEEDGGRWGARGETEEDRTALMISLLKEGDWGWVDLEWDRPLEAVTAAAADSGTRVIRSCHDFDGAMLDRPVDELAGMLREMAAGGAVAKLAVQCGGSRRLLSLARLADAAGDVPDKVILGMGEYGNPSRILAHRFGSAWTYASASGGQFDPPAAAPGQNNPRTLSELYRFGDIGDATPVYGVIGNPVSHSRSPILHNGWLKECGLEGCYLPIRCDDAEALLETCDLLGISGLSVTVPHKEKALELADESDALAARIGAANTLVRRDGKWIAGNTDASGFLEPLPGALGLEGPGDLAGLKALIIGAGGAARAAAHALAEAGVDLVILNRTAEKARRLAAETGARWGSLDASSAGLLSEGVDFAVQTTSVGMAPREDADPVPWWNPAGCRLVYDMIYEPEETVLLGRAGRAGAEVMNGSSMLENQARLQFRMFTGRKPGSRD